MSYFQSCVRDFHKKNQYPSGRRIDLDPVYDMKTFERVNRRLLILNKLLLFMCKRFQKCANKAQANKDPRLYRALLHIEEAAEICEALNHRDDVSLADGVGDLLYVTFGTADCFSIPMFEVFTEIHKANMSKKKRTDSDPRMRDKGEWIPPDIYSALQMGRTNHTHYNIRKGGSSC